MATQKQTSDNAVKDKTGRIWQQWYDLLDKHDCRKKTHKEIVKTISEIDSSVSAWWQQEITVYYERAAGLRKMYEKPNGYDISVSRTIDLPIAELFAYFSSTKKRNSWLQNKGFTIRTKTENKSMRVTWEEDSTSLSINFQPRNPKKSQFSVQHQKLKTQKDAKQKREFWVAQIDILKAMI